LESELACRQGYGLSYICAAIFALSLLPPFLFQQPQAIVLDFDASSSLPYPWLLAVGELDATILAAGHFLS
jgi:hypothetical protein